MSHRSVSKLLLATIAATAVAAPAAQADDRLVAPVTGGENLAFGGGWLAWAQPATEGGFKLMLRAPDGTVSEPQIPRFGSPPNPSIGSDRFAIAERKLVVVYSRCEGASSLRGCDVWRLDTATGTEAPVAALATESYSETAPSIVSGGYSFVRRGSGKRKGVYYYRQGNPSRRVSPTLARETAFNGSRVAYTYNSSRGFGVIIRRVSGEGSVFVAASRLEQEPRSLGVTRYQATWLIGNQPWYTTRFGGSGGPHDPDTLEGTRALPEGVDSIAVAASTLDVRFLDGEGVKAPDPNPFKR